MNAAGKMKRLQTCVASYAQCLVLNRYVVCNSLTLAHRHASVSVKQFVSFRAEINNSQLPFQPPVSPVSLYLSVCEPRM